MQCRTVDVGHPYQEVCEFPPSRLKSGETYINALHESMPACDRVEKTTPLENLEAADRCFIYCAQRSCDAAKDFMDKHRAELRDKCSKITYLPNGALSMNKKDLKQGVTCHAQIIQHNEKASKNACLTCSPQSVDIDATYDGRPLNARHAVTDDKIPDWYIRRGIYSSLPPMFTCDPRFRVPSVHSSDTPVLRLDIRDTQIPPDATIGYWASKPTDEILEAGKAYANFENSGVAKCSSGVCELNIAYPGRYTEDGKVFNPHIHFAVWEGDRWDTVAHTVEFIADDGIRTREGDAHLISSQTP